jgi:hypothetical protein
MRMRQCRRPVGLCLALGFGLAAASSARGEEPSEIVRAAYRASSEGLKSGIGQGRYRRYQAAPGGEWQLKVEADIRTYFDGDKYHIDMTFLRDGLRHNTSARIVCDGRRVMMTWFSPQIHPVGAHTIVEEPAAVGGIVRRPDDGTFPWDVAHLSGNVWNGQGFVNAVATGTVVFRETSAGDLVGTNPIVRNRSRVQVECPRRFGFNMARAVVSVEGEDRPRREYLLRWKLAPGGLWYVTTLQEVFEMRSPGNKGIRLDREVLMYSRFEPNARVAPSLFTEESLQMPDGCRVFEQQAGEVSRVRIYRKR